MPPIPPNVLKLLKPVVDLSTKVWKCPACGRMHRGFTEDKCHNPDCYSNKYKKR